jgi:hypothetical protein
MCIIAWLTVANEPRGAEGLTTCPMVSCTDVRDTDQLGVRAKWIVDGNLADADALVSMQMRVT